MSASSECDLSPRVELILTDLQCILSQYQLNTELFVSPVDAYKVALVLCNEIGSEVKESNSDPEYRLVEDALEMEKASSISSRELVENLTSFSITLKLLSGEGVFVGATLKVYVESDYGLLPDKDLEYLVTVDGLSRSKLEETKSNIDNLIAANSSSTIAELFGLIPEIRSVLLADKKTSSSEVAKKLEKPETKSRYWILSHHIYSKQKRKDMLFWAKENNLNGFCVPGKPGVICVEGSNRSAEDFWIRIRKWNWQNLRLVCTEELNCSCETNSSKQGCFCTKFGPFEELVFENVQSGTKQDMGKFLEYLKGRGSADVFHRMFGIEATNSNKD